MITMTSTLPFTQHMQRYQERIEQQLALCLPAIEHSPMRLHQAMRYASLAGGKRLRALLVYFCGVSLGVTDFTRLDASACAVELIHAYSLIHDDLPAMDNSDLRRGKPTCHLAYDEATAILAGDALQALAFDVLTTYGAPLPDTTRLQMTIALAKACGTAGMAGGQALDLQASQQAITLPELIHLHQLKTGALIECSAMLGTLAAQCDVPASRTAIHTYAHHLGLAFQIQDDILDVSSDTATLGKPQGLDHLNQKTTFVSLLGLEGARQFLREEYQKTVAALDTLSISTSERRALATFVVERTC